MNPMLETECERLRAENAALRRGNTLLWSLLTPEQRADLSGDAPCLTAAEVRTLLSEGDGTLERSHGR